jgi:hypothetical protein
MTKSLVLIFLILTTLPVFGMTETFLRMKPNINYMNFALNHYLSWHTKNFRHNIEHTEFVNALIKRIDHWIVPGHPELDQFLIGHQSDAKGNISISKRIFIHPELRSHPYIVKAHLQKGFEPWFLKLDELGTVCFLGTRPNDKTLMLHHLCRKKNETTFNAGPRDIISQDLTANWPNPFPVLVRSEIKTMDGDKIKSIYYFSESTHPSRLPKELFNVINQHGEHPFFPFNKYSIDDQGKMTVYFP